MELNNIAQEMINTFAKTNKVSKAKVTELVQQVVELQQKKSTNGIKGRPSSQKIMSIEAQLRNRANFTVNSIAAEFEVPYTTAFHMVKRMEKKNQLSKVGESSFGKRGKTAIWAGVN